MSDFCPWAGIQGDESTSQHVGGIYGLVLQRDDG